MTKLMVYVVAAALSAAATVAIAQTAPTTNDRGMAAPSAADPAVRARVLATVNAAQAARQQSGQGGATPGSLIGPRTAAVSSTPVAKAKAPTK